MHAAPGTPELIGRTAELEQVARAVGDPDLPGCILVGVEGVGKSLIARHALARAASDGVATSHVIATRSAATQPLGVLQPLLADDARSADGATLPTGRHLAVPGGGKRLVVLVDDAHLLDDASAALLLEAADGTTVSVLYTVTAGASRPDAVTALWKDRGAERIEIEPLDTAGVIGMTQHLLGGGDVPEWVGERLAQLAGGRPLGVKERVRAARENGQLTCVQGRWQLVGDPPIPAALVDLVSDRIDRMTDGPRELLELLVVCGTLTVTLIERLGLTAALDDLEAADLVQVADRSRHAVAGIVPGERSVTPSLTVQLDHPVYVEAVTTRLTERRRRALYERAAEAAVHLGDIGDNTTTLWRLRAGEPVAADDLLAAANRYYRDGDYARCGELAGAAWQTEPGFAAGQLYGYALGDAGRSAEAEFVLAAAEAFATDDRDLALISMTRSENLLRGLGDPAGSEALCRAAEARIDDPAWRSELSAHRAMGMLRAGRIDQAVAVLDPLLAGAEAHGERAFVTAAYTAGIALIHAGRADDAAVLAVQAMPVHEQLWGADQLTEPGVHHVTTLFAMIATGRLGEVAPLVEFGRDLTRFVVPRYGYAWMSYLAGQAALRAGRCDDAAGSFLEAAPIFRESRRAEEAAWCEAGVAIAAGMQGDGERARAHLEVATSSVPARGRLNWALTVEAQGWLAEADGYGDEARRVFLVGAEEATALGDRLGAAHLLHALARTGGADRALPLLESLAPSIQGALVDLQVATARTLAGGDDPAAALEVAGRAATLGIWVEAAELTAVAVRGLRRAGRAREAARAARVGQERLARCQRIRTPLLADLVSVTPLTDREAEVARLAAARLPSKEIAARLGIAKRTVDNHLRNVYQKLGVGGRADLAQALDIERDQNAMR